MSQFPKDFLWGTATSSYQIEGAADEDGKGESIWDRFCKISGNVNNGDTGAIACDHYHRYKDDIALLKSLGVQAYRFSVSWPRIFPEGYGKVNSKGLDFYKKLVDGLLENDITPMLTLYHWDLPQALQDIGGWTNRDVTDYFTEYSAYLFESLGDRVHHWLTHNEPWVASYLGYAEGEHAPGYHDFRAFVKASHHLLLSHGKTVSEFRRSKAKEGQIGITLNLEPAYPLYNDEEHRTAAKKKEGFLNRWFLDPVFKGRYPEDIRKIYDQHMSLDFIREGDLNVISQDTDFLGINFYSITTHIPDKSPEPENVLKFKSVPVGKPQTDMGWEIDSNGLYDLLLQLKKEYGDIPLYITENGAACRDKINERNEIEDDDRIDYVKSHLSACSRAIENGVNLKGYFVWSLMDNFEWAFGYDKRFGIVYVDYETQKRTKKKSAYFYQDVIANNGI